MDVKPGIFQYTGFALLVSVLVFGHAYALGTPSRDYFTVHELDDGNRASYDLENIDQNHTDRVLKWLRDGRLRDALEDCKYALERFPNHPRALMLIELVAKLMEVPALAIPYYEKALQIYPQYALTHAQYGKYLGDIGDLESGIEHLKRAIKMAPNLPAAHAWLAEAYLKRGDKERARQEIEKARELGYRGELNVERQATNKK